MAIDYTWTNIYVGDDYNNTLVGSAWQDEMYGFGGDDIIVGGYGEDHIDGNNGNDLLAGASLEGFYDPEPDISCSTPMTATTPHPSSPRRAINWLYPSPGDQIVLLGGTPEDVGTILASATTTVTNQTILVYGNTTIGLNGIDQSQVSRIGSCSPETETLPETAESLGALCCEVKAECPHSSPSTQATSLRFSRSAIPSGSS